MMNESLGNCKSNLLRIAVQCGVCDNGMAIDKFIDIIRRRIDAAYELGKAEGVMKQEIKAL
jgi:hypothetical protein